MHSPLILAFSWTDPASWWAIIQVVLGLGFVIFVHELGHFLVAKACGVKCEKFYLGFDAFEFKIGDTVLIPSSLLKWKWGETQYGIGILPLGGYVKMLGQEDNPSSQADANESAEVDDVTGNRNYDPRDYRAKTVPQRMAIISAGVIMNLIFAVIFAAIAFRSGVYFDVPKIGTTISGSPAWQENLAGSYVTRIGERSTEDDYFHFAHLVEAIVLDGDQGEPIAMEIRRPGADQSEQVSVTPVSNLLRAKGASQLPAIGIRQSITNQLSSKDFVSPFQAASRAEPPFEGGDVLVNINGIDVANGFEMQRALLRFWDQEIDVTVQRTSESGRTSEVVVRVPPNPMHLLGVEPELGAVAAIQKGSPADLADVQVGDQLVAVDGQPVGNPLTLDQRLRHRARDGRQVKLTFVRGDEQREFESSLRVAEFTTMKISEQPLAIDSLGIAVHLPSRVANITPNSPADNGKIQAGDEILSVRFDIADDQKNQFSGEINKPIEFPLDDNTGKPTPNQWQRVHALVQVAKTGTPVELKLRRGNDVVPVTLNVAESDQYFQYVRGIIAVSEQAFYQSDSTWDSLRLGLYQTWEDATKVLKFLRRLVTGRLSVTSLGGPGMIAYAATSEASQGTSRLLLFLTLLSANLAIVNFLPIPVLDGGHMVFLAYEGIFRKPVSEKLYFLLSIFGLIFLVSLMLFVIGLDIWRFAF